MNTQERYLTTSEVAATLRVTTRTIRNWLRDGKLRGVKLMGDNWVIPESVLSTLLHPAAADAAVSPDGPGRLDKNAKSTANSETVEPLVAAPSPSPMANRKNRRR